VGGGGANPPGDSFSDCTELRELTLPARHLLVTGGELEWLAEATLKEVGR